MLAFFSAKSVFYPDFDRLLRERVLERFPLCSPEDGE